MIAKHPYEDQPEKAFWSKAVARRNSFEIGELWQPKFTIGANTKIATFGSCFAQHFGRALRRRNFSWLNTEPAPHGMKATSAEKFNYGIFTCRTGNIYTTSLLLQWLAWAHDPSSIPEQFWHNGKRYFDPFRPTIEPDGFASVDELIRSRVQTAQSLREAVERADIFVFTLGLTESWVDTRGWEYPVCPGTAAGKFDPMHHAFVNQPYREIRAALASAIKRMKEINKKLRILLTVSPVPLTATGTEKHVLVATMQSKSTLRAVAGELADSLPYADYFPSYEIINSPAFGGAFFEPNKRSVSAFGVNFVMEQFFHSIGAAAPQVPKSTSEPTPKLRSVEKQRWDAKCDEELLEAFSGSGQ
jgi:hypothetical protein